MRLISIWIGAIMASGSLHAAGRFLPPEQFASTALGTNRTVRIWLPPSYDSAPAARYPVLYLHDGQNVFSSAGPHVGFGWGNWEVDLTAERLVTEKRTREIILVAAQVSQHNELYWRLRVWRPLEFLFSEPK